MFLELAEALQQGKPVVPALIEGTSMPAANTLPTDLRALADINAISVHGDPTFRRDSARLIEAIREVVAGDRVRADQERLAALEAGQSRRDRSDRSVNERSRAASSRRTSRSRPPR